MSQKMKDVGNGLEKHQESTRPANRGMVKNGRLVRMLTEEGVLSWADAYHQRTGSWPKRVSSGRIPSSGGKTWTAVDIALARGTQGLSGGSSLAKLLAARRGVRNRGGVPKLTEEEILAWADLYHQRTGRWPKHDTGAIDGSGGETWKSVNSALENGLRGFPGGSSLAKLLSARRGFVRQGDRPKLTKERILAWADAHYQRTGRWPRRDSGVVVGGDGGTWGAVSAALREGARGLPGGSTVERLLAARRGAPLRPKRRPELTETRILEWADAHYRRTGRWPKHDSGAIDGVPGETWRGVDGNLAKGYRGFPGGSSLAKLLAARRGVRSRSALPKLTEEKILAWADVHYRQTGVWPHSFSGAVIGAEGEKWGALNASLRNGTRGLPGGSSVAELLLRRRKIRQKLTEELILAWADEHHQRTKMWPKHNSGIIAWTNGERWKRIDEALQRGSRGLPGKMTLARLLFARRGVVSESVSQRPRLTEEHILVWADEYHRRTGRWPSYSSGTIAGVPGERWQSVSNALKDGYRGLPGGSSLAKLLFARRQTKKFQGIPTLPRLTEEQILVWADEYHRRTGRWPNRDAGVILETEKTTWMAVADALTKGYRGLPGGLSLAKLLAARRGFRTRSALPKLTEEKILAWADAHHRRTGRWPKHDSGAIDGSGGETWGSVNGALEKGYRGFPGGSSLFKLLVIRRGAG